MVCQTYGLRAGRLSRKIAKTMKTTKIIQTATNKELSAGFAEITETTKITKTTGIRVANHGFPQTTGIEIPELLLGTQEDLPNKYCGPLSVVPRREIANQIPQTKP